MLENVIKETLTLRYKQILKEIFFGSDEVAGLIYANSFQNSMS